MPEYSKTTVGVGKDPWTLINDGKQLFYGRPTAEMFSLENIAYTLAGEFRFGNQTRYTVAQHSCFVAGLVQMKLQEERGPYTDLEMTEQILAALFHDAAEGYTHDFPTPFKVMVGEGIQKVENAILAAIFDLIDVDLTYFNQIVKDADHEALLTERYFLLPDHEEWRKVSRQKLVANSLQAISVERAEAAFLKTAQALLRRRDALREQAA